MPKSVSKAAPSSASRMLLGLTSRWTTPCSWAWASALATSRAILMASGSGSAFGADCPSHCATDPPRTSCDTRNVTPSRSPTSWSVTMCGWSPSRAAARASRSNRVCSGPSTSVSVISANATSRSSSSSRARNTRLLAPRPSGSRTRYRPIESVIASRPELFESGPSCSAGSVVSRSGVMRRRV